MAACNGATGFKASETLLGIETLYLDINLREVDWFKASETLLGIETDLVEMLDYIEIRFKASETLLGIETYLYHLSCRTIEDSKPLKPF